MADRIKLIVALLLVAVAIVGFYYFSEYLMLYRVLGLLLVIGAALGLVLTTEMGRVSAGYVKDARTEVRKVVWPTRKETGQTTMLIMAAVVVVGIFLWLLDMGLLALVQLLTGQGS